MTPEKLIEIKKLCQAKPLLKEFYDHYQEIVTSPYYEGYVGVKTTINNLNRELMEGVAEIKPRGDEELPDQEAADKAFERSHKYIVDMKKYYDQLDFFSSKLSSAEVKKADEEAETLVERALSEKTNR